MNAAFIPEYENKTSPFGKGGSRGIFSLKTASEIPPGPPFSKGGNRFHGKKLAGKPRKLCQDGCLTDRIRRALPGLQGKRLLWAFWLAPV